MRRKAVALMIIAVIAGLCSAQSLGSFARAVLMTIAVIAGACSAKSLRQQRAEKNSGASKVITSEELGAPAASVNPELEGILKALKSDDVRTRTSVMMPLWDLPNEHRRTEADIAPLVSALAETVLDRNLNIRYMAASTLRNFATVAKPAVPNLIQALDTFPGRTPALEGPERYYADARAVAAEALGAIGPDASDAIPALTKTLKDPSPAVRKAASDALRKISGEAVAPPL